jgi:hypothetical protein
LPKFENLVIFYGPNSFNTINKYSNKSHFNLFLKINANRGAIIIIDFVIIIIDLAIITIDFGAIIIDFGTIINFGTIIKIIANFHYIMYSILTIWISIFFAYF